MAEPEKRQSKNSYYLNIAQVVAERSTCLRRRYGAVLVKEDRIVSTGYNGSPRGAENCCDTGLCWRQENHIAHGERYEACLSGETRIRTLDGKNPKIKDMVGGEYEVFAIDESGHIVPATAVNIRKTGNKPVCRVVFDDGNVIECTKDHRFLMRDLSYKEAGELQNGDSVMPYYGWKDTICNTWRERENKPTKDERHHWAKTCKTPKMPIMYLVYAHHNKGFDKGAIRKNGVLVLHHKNGDHHDNRLENLEMVGRKWHIGHHTKLRIEAESAETKRARALKGNESQKVLLETDAAFRQRKSEVGTKNMTALWNNPEWVANSKSRLQDNGKKTAALTNSNPDAIRSRQQGILARGISWLMFVSGTKEIPLDEYEHYRQQSLPKASIYHKAPKLQTILKWFATYEDAMEAGKHYNHKVVAVVETGMCEDVYDMEVPTYHNFAVVLDETTGVFVHNCEAVHAEANALLNGTPADMKDATLYLVGMERKEGKWELLPVEEVNPCAICEKLIRNAGIAEVVVGGL